MLAATGEPLWAESLPPVGRDPQHLIQVMLAKGGRFFSRRSPKCIAAAAVDRRQRPPTQNFQPETPNCIAMIATADSFEPHSSEQLPKSKRVYLRGQIHADVKVPVREIAVTDTKSYTGAVTPNDPVRVYDCSGPWGDPAFTGTSEQGLPALRREWILKRGDVEEIEGREVKPQDDGYLSGKHAEYASKAEKNRLVEFPGLTSQRRRPLRAKPGDRKSVV